MRNEKRGHAYRRLLWDCRELGKNPCENTIVDRSGLISVKASHKRNDERLEPILRYQLHLQIIQFHDNKNYRF